MFSCLFSLICIVFMYVFLWFILSFFLIVCLLVTVKWLAVKTASKMTYTVSGGALNSTLSNPILCLCRFGWLGLNKDVPPHVALNYTGVLLCLIRFFSSCSTLVIITFLADRTATQYDRLLASSCCPSVCLWCCALSEWTASVFRNGRVRSDCSVPAAHRPKLV